MNKLINLRNIVYYQSANINLISCNSLINSLINSPIKTKQSESRITFNCDAYPKRRYYINMVHAKFLLIFALTIFYLEGLHGHGMLMEPVNRGSAWRKGFKTPVNYDDDGNYCGGLFVSEHYYCLAENAQQTPSHNTRIV